MKRIARVPAVALITVCLTPVGSYAGSDVQDARVQRGKLWYDQYCTPCHGPGGAPGFAVFAGTKKLVDLRSIAQRNGGNFPSMKWWDFIFSSEPTGVHAPSWNRIRSDQIETVEAERDIAAHGVAANIEYYVESIQSRKR